MQFDYDQRNGTSLVVSLNSLQSKQLVPHQLQMLLNNQIPQLLNVELESKNDSYQLHYDLSKKKRLFQTLQTCPPTIHLFYEMVYRLVQTIVDSSMYMLDEGMYILHSDFIYCGRDVGDLYLCYLPMPNAYKVRIEEQLRLLILRMLASVNSFDEDYDEVLKMIKVIQEEDYLIPNLQKVLKDAWIRQASVANSSTSLSQKMIIKEADSKNRGYQQMWLKIKGLWNKQKGLETHSVEPTFIDRRPITGVTEMLVLKQDTSNKEDIQVVINRNNVEEVIHFMDDHFIIGRNKTGVHYVDVTEGISRVHCEFVKSNESVEVRDLGSLNGSYLNGEILIPYKSYPFRVGDLLRIVSTEVRILS